GQCHLRLGAPTDAVGPLERVLADHADHDLADDAAALLAEAHYAAGAFKNVAAPVQRLARTWPDSPRRERAELLLALSSVALGDDQAAARQLASIRRAFPRGVYADETELLLAQCLDRAGGLDAAVKQYQRVIEHGRDAFVPEARYGLASLQYRRGNLTPAAALLDALLKQTPAHGRAAEAQLLRGRIDFDEDRLDEARRRFDALLAGDLGPLDEAAYWRAKCDLAGGKPRAAATRLAATIKRHPDSPLLAEMRYDAAVALIRADAAGDALTALERFRTTHADHALAPEAAYLAVAALHELARYEECGVACEAFLDAYPAHARADEVAFLHAESAYLDDDLPTAAQLYAAHRSTRPQSPHRERVAFRLGVVLHQLGRDDEAVPLLVAIAESPTLDAAFRPALLALGDLHFQRGEWDKARVRLTAYLEADETPAAADDAMLKLGLCHQRLEDPEAALTVFDALLEDAPDSRHHAHAQFERGQTLVTLDRNEDAVTAFETLLREHPDAEFAAAAFDHLGALAFAAGDHATAAEHYRAAAARSTDPSRVALAQLQRGRALSAEAAHGPAADVLTALLETHPDADCADEARAYLAIALSRSERPAEALAAIGGLERGALETLPPELQTAVRYEKAWTLRGLERKADAAVAYRRLIEHAPNDPLSQHARLELAELERDAGRDGEAATQLRALLAGDRPPAPLRSEALYRLGAAEFTRTRHEPAVEAFETFIADYPEHELVPSARLLCGEALFHLGRHERALTHLAAIPRSSTDAETVGASLLRRGECHAALQQWAKSAAMFETYLKQFPKADLWFQARFGAGWALENQDKRAEAITAYRDVVARHQGPTAARAQFQIGECLFADERHQEAVAELLKVDILYAYPEWSAAALYEAGRCFRALSDPVAARKQFEQVTRDHAETNWARLAARQLEELGRAALPGHDRAEGKGS
ncbi:MAG: tetratricopeptide repeat protein, partial [Phycisphaerae bacterium]|nr:tetratricopeptide repeat protein [Phycisphaerae bacterium]